MLRVGGRRGHQNKSLITTDHINAIHSRRVVADFSSPAHQAG